MAKKWPEKDEKFLEVNFQEMSNEQLAKKLGASESSVRTKMSRLGLKREENPRTPKIELAKAKRKAAVKPKIKKKPVTRDTIHENIRCRQCLIVDGYAKEEEICRYCGAKLFKGDVL